RQAFPVAQWPLDAGSPLTVAGAATDVVKFEGSNLSCPCSLFRPRPSRGTSTSKCSPRTPQGVKSSQSAMKVQRNFWAPTGLDPLHELFCSVLGVPSYPQAVALTGEIPP